MAEHPNLQLAHRAWAAVAASDVDALAEIWAPDIVWHVTSRNPWTGDHVGQDAVLDYLADVGEVGEAYDMRLDDVLVSDERMLLVCHITARRAGKTVETGQLLLARVASGRIAEVWTLPLDPSAFNGFFPEPRQTWSRVGEGSRQAGRSPADATAEPPGAGRAARGSPPDPTG